MLRAGDVQQVIAKAVVAEVAKYAFRFLLVGSVALFGWLVATDGLNQLGVARWPLGIALASALALAISMFLDRKSIYRPRYPRQTFPYEVLKKTLTYKIGSDGLLHFSRRMHIRALRDNVEEFIDRYIWTAGPMSVPGPGDNIVRTEPLARAGIWSFFKAEFGRSLRRGEEYEFEIKWPAIANWADSSPFVSTSTEEPTHELVFILHLPERHANSHVLAEVMRGIEAVYPFHYEELSLEDGRCTWRVNKPSLYTHYRLRWTWRGDDPQTIEESLRDPKEASPLEGSKEFGER